MTCADNFALVTRPSGALEKPAPGTKRILSGMVADALALARQARSLRVVVIEYDQYLLEVYVKCFSEKFGQVEFVSFDKPLKALEELEERDPDLLITQIGMPKMNGFQLIERLFARKIQYPILVLSAYHNAKERVEGYAKRDFNIRYSQMPENDPEMEKLLRLIGELLQIPHGSTEETARSARAPEVAHQPRIVVIYSEERVTLAIGQILRHSFNNVKLLLFDDSRKAWEELSRITPDLLITYDRMPGITGEEIVRRLAAQGVTFPIVVLSGFGPVTRPWVEGYVSRGLNIKYLDVPPDVPTFRNVVAASLNIPLSDSAKSEVSFDKAEKPAPTLQQSRRTVSPRIVILDDEPSFREVYSMLLKEWYDGAELLEFREGNEAWQELSRASPDLFITDRAHTGMPCHEMLERLAERKVKFPILLISGSVNLLVETALRSASENLNFSVTHKPFEVESFRTAVEAALQIPTRRAS